MKRPLISDLDVASTSAFDGFVIEPYVPYLRKLFSASSIDSIPPKSFIIFSLCQYSSNASLCFFFSFLVLALLYALMCPNSLNERPILTFLSDSSNSFCTSKLASSIESYISNCLILRKNSWFVSRFFINLK